MNFPDWFLNSDKHWSPTTWLGIPWWGLICSAVPHVCYCQFCDLSRHLQQHWTAWPGTALTLLDHTFWKHTSSAPKSQLSHSLTFSQLRKTSIIKNQLLIKPSIRPENQTWDIYSFHPSMSVPVRKNKVISFRLQLTPCLGVYLLKPLFLLEPWLRPFSSRCYQMMPKGKLPWFTPIWHQVAVRQDLACEATRVFFDSLIRLSHMPKCCPSS